MRLSQPGGVCNIEPAGPIIGRGLSSTRSRTMAAFSCKANSAADATKPSLRCEPSTSSRIFLYTSSLQGVDRHLATVLASRQPSLPGAKVVHSLALGLQHPAAHGTRWHVRRVAYHHHHGHPVRKGLPPPNQVASRGNVARQRGQIAVHGWNSIHHIVHVGVVLGTWYSCARIPSCQPAPSQA